jgi:uncharacterized FlaG/YvyC family protein
MNIYPSDTEVRQGFSPAESVALPQTVQENTKAAATAPESRPQAQDATDAHSSKVASTADRTEAKAAAQKINEQLQANNTALKIRVLDDSEQGVQAEIVDTKSDKVLRKIPQDELLKLSASIKQMTGVVLNHPA